MTSISSVTIFVPAKCPCFKSEVEMKAGVRYLFEVKGRWADFKDDPVDANGNASPGGVRELFGWARRSPEAPWMALLFRIKSADKVSSWRWLHDGANVLSDLPSGRLQLCANDVLGFYWNNSGELEVSVVESVD